MNIITKSGKSIQEFLHPHFNKITNSKYSSLSEYYGRYDINKTYDIMTEIHLNYIIEHLVYGIQKDQSSNDKLSDFPPQYKLCLLFNINNFIYANEHLYNPKSKNPTKPYFALCREMIKKIRNEILWILVHYLDPDSEKKDINKVELSYGINDNNYYYKTGIFKICFTWRIKPLFWPKYQEYLKKNNNLD
jgi:hypothetical protein